MRMGGIHWPWSRSCVKSLHYERLQLTGRLKSGKRPGFCGFWTYRGVTYNRK